MKKLLIISVAVFITAASFSQAKFGLKAGLNIANLAIEVNGSSLSPSPAAMTGFHVGGIVEIPFNDAVAFQPGILFSRKGAKIDLTSLGSDYGIYNETLNYIDIPLNLMCKFGEGSTKFFLLAGPVISYGLSGTDESDGESVDITFGDADYEYKKLDFALDFGAGVDVNGFQISVQYNLGLTNIINPGTADFSFKNNVIGISVAYLFSGGGTTSRSTSNDGAGRPKEPGN